MPTASRRKAAAPARSLNKLFQAAFSAAKRVRTETRIGANAVSLASATVSLARRVYRGFERAHRADGRRRRNECADGAAFHERRASSAW